MEPVSSVQSDLTKAQGLLWLLRKLGPYVALEILMPGGTLLALLLFLYRRLMARGGYVTVSADVQDDEDLEQVERLLVKLPRRVRRRDPDEVRQRAAPVRAMWRVRASV